MMVRTQIQLEKEDHEALKAWARRRGLSVSAAIRLLVRESVSSGARDADERSRRLLSAAGAIRGGKDEGYVSRDHDRYLYGPSRKP